MRHSLITLVASFVGVIAALFAFYSYRDAADARARAALDAEQQAKVEQGRMLAERTIASERAAQAIRDALIVASGAKASVSEYYMANGRMPDNNAVVGLAEPETFVGQSLRSLKVSEGGKITLAFDASSGIDGGTIELVPDLGGHESMGVQWQCTTHDFVHIARAWPWPDCKFVPAGKVEVSNKP